MHVRRSHCPKAKNYAVWSENFFKYLVAEKAGPNHLLLELVASLGSRGQQKLGQLIFEFLDVARWKEFCKNRRTTGKAAHRRLSKAIRDTRRAELSYRKLLMIAPEIGVGRALGADAPAQFAELLELESRRLSRQRDLAKRAFSKKRGGVRHNLAILIFLQDFTDEFVLRWNEATSSITLRRLRIADIADLLEAGKQALGLREDLTIIDASALERALQRFRSHPDNTSMLTLIANEARAYCRSCLTFQFR